MQELMYVGDLPAELWLRILSYLGPNDLVMFARSCRTNRTVAADQLLWRKMCQRWFPLFIEIYLRLIMLIGELSLSINTVKSIDRLSEKSGFIGFFLKQTKKYFLLPYLDIFLPQMNYVLYSIFFIWQKV